MRTRKVSDQIIATLCDLVPSDGIRVAFDSDKYFEDTVCNFISLSSDADVPENVVKSREHLLVEVVLDPDTDTSSTMENFDSVTCSNPCPANLPTILIEIEKNDPRYKLL